MKRNKEEKHAKSTKGGKKKGKKVGNEKLGENFCGKKNKSGGKACPIEFFLIRLYNLSFL